MDVATATAVLSPTIPPIIVQVATPSIPTSYAAWFGAVVSLLVLLFNIWKHNQDRPKLKITYTFNQEIIGRTVAGTFKKLFQGKTFWSIMIVNVGSKDIIITALNVSKNSKFKFAQVTMDASGDIPKYTLVPGDNHYYNISNEMLDPKTIKEILITDGTGKVHKKKVRYKE